MSELIPELRALTQLSINAGTAVMQNEDGSTSVIPMGELNLYLEDSEGGQSAVQFLFEESEAVEVAEIVNRLIDYLRTIAAGIESEEANNG